MQIQEVYGTKSFLMVALDSGPVYAHCHQEYPQNDTEIENVVKCVNSLAHILDQNYLSSEATKRVREIQERDWQLLFNYYHKESNHDRQEKIREVIVLDTETPSTHEAVPNIAMHPLSPPGIL